MIDEAAIDAELEKQEKESFEPTRARTHVIEPNRLREMLQRALDVFLAEVQKFDLQLPIDLCLVDRNRTTLERFTIDDDWRAQIGRIDAEKFHCVFPVKFLATARRGRIVRASLNESGRLSPLERLN